MPPEKIPVNAEADPVIVNNANTLTYKCDIQVAARI
jgi:hypothetical protein